MPRGNPQNLKPNTKGVRTLEERRALASKAGIASGKARRERRTLREELSALLSAGDTQTKLVNALLAEALNGNKAGSVTRAFEVIRDTVGEKPIEKVMLAEVDKAVIDEVEQMMKED